MVMWSHKTMLKHSRLSDEMRDRIEQLAKELDEMEYGQKLEAIKCLGYHLPALGGHGGRYPMDMGMADAITHGVLRANLPTMHKYVMDLCMIGQGKFLDDAIINSVVVHRWDKNTTCIKLNDNRSDSKSFTINVKANSISVKVAVHKTGQEGRYNDLRDEGFVMAWEADHLNATNLLVMDEISAEEDAKLVHEEEMLHKIGSSEGWIKAYQSLPIEEFDIGCEDRNHYFCSAQNLFGMVLADCWDQFNEKCTQQELDLFDEQPVEKG